MSEREDPLLDRLLSEELGGERPPDLTHHILARLQNQTDLRDATWPPSRHRPRLGFAVGGLIGAGAALLALWLSLTGLLRSSDSLQQHWVKVEIRQGDLAVHAHSGAVTARGQAGELIRVQWLPRDRLVMAAATTLDIESLGRLRTDSDTTLEIMNMEWKPFGIGATLGAVTVAVIAGAIHWSSGSIDMHANKGNTAHLTAGDPGTATAKIDELTQRVQQLETELQSERGKLAAERRQNVPVENKPGDSPALAANAKPEATKMRPGFGYFGLDQVLEQVDWDKAGEALHKMIPALEQLCEKFEATGDVPIELAGEVQKLNGELVVMVSKLAAADIPGTGYNGKFTHPVIVANQLHATLTKAGMPLNNEQRDLLQKLGSQFAGEDDQRRAQLPEGSNALRAALAETELKDRFYAQARAMLSPEQQKVLFPTMTAGTNGDLFSTAILWSPLAKPVEFTNRSDFGSSVAQSIGSDLGLEGEVATRLRGVVDAWAAAMPEDAFVARKEPYAKLGIRNGAPVRDAARRQAELYELIERGVSLTDAQRADLRKKIVVYVPQKR